MKVRCLLCISFMTTVFFLPSCKGKKNINSFIYYKVSETCENMGTIKGDNRQNPLVGDYTTEVTAIPKEGYVFVGWNDNCTEATRKDKATEEIFVIYIAFFEEINE